MLNWMIPFLLFTKIKCYVKLEDILSVICKIKCLIKLEDTLSLIYKIIYYIKFVNTLFIIYKNKIHNQIIYKIASLHYLYFITYIMILPQKWTCSYFLMFQLLFSVYSTAEVSISVFLDGTTIFIPIINSDIIFTIIN